MFQIPDDDLLWDDDFQVEDITVAEGTHPTFASKSLSVESLPAELVAQDDMGRESLKHEPGTSLLNRLPAGDSYSKKYNEDGKSTPMKDVPKFCKRKFPGPAGILPPYSPSVVLDTKLPDSPNVVAEPKSPNVNDLKDGLQPSQLSWSQAASDDIFKSPQWKALVSDLGTDSESVIAKFSIKSALLKAGRKLLHRGKVPLIIGVIDSLEMQGSDASIVIRDPSGKMNGALHRDLFKDQSTALQIGSVLVLRQVSVISPSGRTHYLNITPGNVVLVYSANKEAAVSKHLYDVSHSFTNSPEIDTKVSKTQFLHQIIKTSEQELSNAVKNYHQRSTNHSSPSLENSSNRLNSRYLSPAISRDPFVLQRNHMNVTPAGRSGVSLFSCSPQPLSNVMHGKIVTPQSSVKIIGNVNLMCPKQIMPNPAQVFGSKFPIQHGTPNCARSDNVSSPAVQQSRSALINSNISLSSANRLQANSVDRSQFSSCLNITPDKNTPSHIKSYYNNIPNDDDEMLLAFCDDVFTENLDVDCISNREDVGPNSHGECDRDKGIVGINSTSGTIISDVFSDCRKENERINNSFKKKHVYEGSSFLSHLGDHLKSPGHDLNINTNVVSGTANNSPSLLQARSDVKKFSFKRSFPASDLPQMPVPLKRSAGDVARQTVDTPKRNTSVHPRNVSAVSTNMENCDNFQPSHRSHLPVVEHSTVKPTEARVVHCVPGVNRAVSAVEQSKPVVNLATSVVHKTIPSSAFTSSAVKLKTAICSKGVAESGCSSGRNLGVTGQSSVFQVWDSDLSDEMLLSQLSDEF